VFFPDLPLLPAIPLSVKSAESAAERTSVLHYLPRSNVAAAYREVGAWLEAVPGNQAASGIAGARGSRGTANRRESADPPDTATAAASPVEVGIHG
jgi:hypothetical protein